MQHVSDSKAVSVTISDPTCRLKRAAELTGLTRTHFYALERSGLLQLIRVKVPGAKRGATLVRIRDLDRLIASAAGNSVIGRKAVGAA